MWHDVRLLNAITNVLLTIFVVIVLAGCFLWFAEKPFFLLKVIHVQEAEGKTLKHVNAFTVRGVALPRIKGNFFTVDLDAVREAFKAVPWVREATVRRKWPNGLEVSIEEHKPLGTWGEDGRLLSVKGDVFTANLAEAEEEVNLLKFYGPEGSEKEVVLRYEELKRGFATVSLEPVRLELSERYAWRTTLNNGVTVRFGREQGNTTMREQMKRLLAVYPRLAAQLKSGIRGIDLRYPNGLALKADTLVPDVGGQ
ncbi:cell division protein FtsQ/DivIB [Oxalobacter sp. OttesenSCG-928-P03]|nr:cell division protein FtsQ/DivIB [Oxalobacter sp. OttesenSCG-928-P03]